MSEKFLFSLENCMKCIQTKELLENRDDIEFVTFPHNLDDWTEKQKKIAKNHNVFEDLQVTAPILWIDGDKKTGYLRIRKWIQDSKK